MIEIYTDGSCKRNPGPGAYGYIVYKNDQQYTSYVKYINDQTTNNVMELYGVLSALEFIHSNELNESYIIYTDSQYVQLGITKWIHKWINNNWLTSEQKPVLNQSIWKRIWSLYKSNIVIQWIPAHTNAKDIHSIRNSYIDELVQKAY